MFKSIVHQDWAILETLKCKINSSYDILGKPGILRLGKMLYFNTKTFTGRKTLQILKSSMTKQRSKSDVTAQPPENVICIMSRYYI